ncbi:hypothetical protein AB0I02_22920 [Streptomyces phaeochromogenes]
MIVMQPVLEMTTTEGFDLWPVAEIEAFGFLPLSSELSPTEVGTAVMRIAGGNDVDPVGRLGWMSMDPARREWSTCAVS